VVQAEEVEGPVQPDAILVPAGTSLFRLLRKNYFWTNCHNPANPLLERNSLGIRGQIRLHM